MHWSHTEVNAIERTVAKVIAERKGFRLKGEMRTRRRFIVILEGTGAIVQPTKQPTQKIHSDTFEGQIWGNDLL